MENKRKPKYDIPLIIVDTRQHRSDFVRKEKRSQHILKTNEETLPDLGTMLKYLILSFQKPLVALKYRLFKILDKFFEDVEVPWLKIIALSLVAFMAFKKDIKFNLSFNGPENGLLKEDQNGTGNLAKTTTFGVSGNPYAPVAPQSLADKKAIAFIKQYEEVAKTEMNKFGIPASIKMAQALIESNAGSSRLATKNNNLFGIKCFSHNCKKGHCTNATDDHHKDFFRKYESAWESWRSHSNLLQSKRYLGLKKLGKNYKQWAKGLKKAGYATDKNYAEKLIDTIEKYQLYKLDN
jgi:mannosyl-glycoprotein endo-beta-N-acetylglucosaminidase